MINPVKIKEITGKIVGYVIIAILSFIFGIFIANTNANTGKQLPAMPENEIKLSEYKVLWDTEIQEVTLMNRKNNAVILVLSKEVTAAVFSLKASAIQSDFSQVTNGGVAPKKSYTNKITSQPKSVPTAPK